MRRVYSCIHPLIIAFTIICFLSCKGQEKSETIQSETVKSEAQIDSSYLKITTDSTVRRSHFKQIHSNLDEMVYEFVRKMHQDKNGNYWFGTNGDGIILYNGDTLLKYTVNGGRGRTAERGIQEDQEGIIWFATSKGLINFNGKSFTRYANQGEGDLDDDIWSIHIDRNGLKWLGTVDGVFTFDGAMFSSFPLPQAEVGKAQPMISHKRISKIIEDRGGDMWFATDGYGICIYDGVNFTHLSTKDGLPDNNVPDIIEDKQGNKWFGSYLGGLCRYDGENFKNFSKEGIIDGVEVYNFCKDKEGHIWFSAENIGVYRFDGTSFSKFTIEDGLVNNGIQSIYADKKGNIWFGSWQGLSIYHDHQFYNATVKEPWTK